jgi:hypothetical protein
VEVAIFLNEYGDNSKPTQSAEPTSAEIVAFFHQNLADFCIPIARFKVILSSIYFLSDCILHGNLGVDLFNTSMG